MNNQILLARLKGKYEESGLSYEEVSEKSGVSVSSLRRFFVKGDIPTVRTLLKLSRAIDFSFDYIFQLKDKDE